MRRCQPVDLSIVHIDMQVGQKRPRRLYPRNPFERPLPGEHVSDAADTSWRRQSVPRRLRSPQRRSPAASPRRWHRPAARIESPSTAPGHGPGRRERYRHAGGLEGPFDHVGLIDRIVHASCPRPRSSSRSARRRIAECPLVRPGFDPALADRIGPQVVDAVDLVGVLVRPDHRVDAFDVGIQQLRTQVGRGVDQHRSCPCPGPGSSSAGAGCGRPRGWPPPTRPSRPCRPAAERLPRCRSRGSSPALPTLRLGKQPEEILGGGGLEFADAHPLSVRRPWPRYGRHRLVRWSCRASARAQGRASPSRPAAGPGECHGRCCAAPPPP